MNKEFTGFSERLIRKIVQSSINNIPPNETLCLLSVTANILFQEMGLGNRYNEIYAIVKDSMEDFDSTIRGISG